MGTFSNIVASKTSVNKAFNSFGLQGVKYYAFVSSTKKVLDYYALDSFLMNHPQVSRKTGTAMDIKEYVWMSTSKI